MSFLSKVFNVGVKQVTKVARAVTSETAKTASITGRNVAGKIQYMHNGQDVTHLIESKEAKAFIESARKQNATIVSDVITPHGPGSHHLDRVVTKRLPSGTTVAERFGWGGLEAKEVIGKGKSSVSIYGGSSNKVWQSATKKADGSYVTTYYNSTLNIPAGAKPAYIPDAAGMTERANADFADYQALLNMGLVHKSSM